MLNVYETERVPSEDCSLKITSQMNNSTYYNEKFNPVCLHPNGSCIAVNY